MVGTNDDEVETLEVEEALVDVDDVVTLDDDDELVDTSPDSALKFIN